jgi:purine-nucleoside phosphorylase
MGRLGGPRILLTNAAGGIKVAWPAGTLMALTDHLNLTGLSPLLGTNPDQLGPRFPDLTDAWDPDLRARLHEAARLEGIRLEEGVYAGLLGPSYETPAEVRMLRSLGADAVGMSTVLEAIAARWAGLRLAGVSLVTNPAAGVTGEPLSHEEVIQAADAAAPRFERLVSRFVSLLPD